MRAAGATRVAKSKSMATEEIDLNPALEAAGAEVVETDLGEWIIQLAGETPSHIIAPALHKDRHQIKDLFVDAVAAAATLDTEPAELVAFARGRLREVFLAADIGITGANFAVAETGSIVLVTNEGNGRLVTALPRIHVAVMGMERVAADWDQADLLLALLARSATGQRLSSYTNVVTGPRGGGELDGPDELHVVILDNGRSELLGGEFHEMLDCIRCGACLNVCPVYRQIGGHAYGWVYPGPMGAVLTPLLAADQPEAAELAGASTLCGACMDACPVQIPLQDLLLSLRRRKAEGAGRGERAAWRAWAAAWSDPRRYDATTRAATWGRWAADLAGHLPGGAGLGAPAAPCPARPANASATAGGPACDDGRRGTGRETGDRAAFLAPARARLAGGIAVNPVHPPPPPRRPGEPVPLPRYRNLDPDDLVGTFAAAVAHAEGVCHVVDGDVPDDLLDRLVDELGGRPVVTSREPAAERVGERLAARGVAVGPAPPSRPRPRPAWGSRAPWPASPPPDRWCSTAGSPAAASPRCCPASTSVSSA